jgi:hypothetical protein
MLTRPLALRWVKLLLAGLVLVPAFAYGAFMFWQISAPSCTTRIIAVQTALDKSKDELQRASSTVQPAKCSLYRRHIEALAEATQVSALCGPPQAMPRALFPITDGELRIYERLLSEECA